MAIPVEITVAAVIGVLTIIFSILVKVLGIPDQIRKNFKRKSTKGLSTIFFILTLIAYSFWTIHGIIQKDTILIIGQGAGIITTGIIVSQIILYRKNK